MKYHNYMGTKLAYDILCDPTCSDNKEKEGDNLRGNRLINLKIENQPREFLVCQKFAQEKYL